MRYLEAIFLVIVDDTEVVVADGDDVDGCCCCCMSVMNASIESREEMLEYVVN